MRYSKGELNSIQSILTGLENGDISQAVQELERLKEKIYDNIPDKQRQSRGITWVLLRISGLIIGAISSESELKTTALTLNKNIAENNRLQGVPVFLMAEYGRNNPMEVLGFFEELADSPQWEIREFSAGGLQKFLEPNKDTLSPWLKKLANSERPNLRRFVSEALRPVSGGRWLKNEPEYSLRVLGLLFRESHPYPRTSVGNNLSDLSKVHPALILSIVEELVTSEDRNSFWIAKRACRNLIKEYPERVLDTLQINEYRYKDRHYYRTK